MKKRKRHFIALLIIIIWGVGILILHNNNIIPSESYSNSDFNIETYHSEIDKDDDGIDDQTDILQSVQEYIATNPTYKSKYYETGYPNDRYGVCTDVVAFGLLGAGYDLMELVNKDIIEHREHYDIDEPDENIDFRRVRNLQVYFKNNAISLTTNIKDISQWQGGDIVIFNHHIAIVSDVRNKNGVPFIIHHNSLLQAQYQEDVLEYYDDIVGHYRIS